MHDHLTNSKHIATKSVSLYSLVDFSCIIMYTCIRIFQHLAKEIIKLFEDIEHALREKTQQDSLREEALQNALREWIADPRHNYSKAARKYNLTYSAFWNYVQRKRLEASEQARDTEHGLQVVALQSPKQNRLLDR